MATTPNFGWSTPDNTGLVKNGALDIRTLGNAIDSSMMDLKGGTTGQVLTKASNTDMDFSWVADATGIPATIFDAKGDIIAATAADTASRLAVGTNGQVLTADSAEATGLKWATPSSGTPAFVGASVYNSANVSINHNTYTQIPFNSELFDTDNFHSTSTNNSRLTIPSGKDGKYSFTFAILADPYGTAAKNVTRLYKNGSGGKIMVFDTNAGDDASFFIQGIESAVAGDYFEIYCNQNTGTTRNASGGTTYMWFSIQYLGA